MWVFELIGVVSVIVLYDIFLSDKVREKGREILTNLRSKDLNKET